MVERFKKEHKKAYKLALREIKRGKKENHWIWYIFPQLKSLGMSATSQYYGIADLKEAQEYYNDRLLRKHLLEITNALYKVENKSIEDILGWDDIKVKSCMTLFYIVSQNALFKNVIDKYYNGEFDIRTIELLGGN